MWHAIARKIGCTVAEAQARMDSAEFVEWAAEYAMEPWDDHWRQSALITAAVINQHRRPGTAVKPDQLIPRTLNPRLLRRQSPDDMFAIFQQAARVA